MMRPLSTVYLAIALFVGQQNAACAIHPAAAAASFVANHRNRSRPITSTVTEDHTNKIVSSSFHQDKHINSNALFIRGGAGAGTALKSSPSSLITTIVPKIGVLTSTLLYFSPFPSVQHATSSNDVGELNPIPLSIMAVSSLCWLVYGLSIRNPYVTLSNVPGCIVSIWYVVSILPLLKTDTLLRQTQNLTVFLSAVTIHLWTYLSLSNKNGQDISRLLGMYASLLFILLSGSPLSTIRSVLSSKSSKSILTPLTCAQVVNTSLWSMYGLAVGDVFVYGPNLVGLGFGLVQLLLKVVFRG